MKKFLVQERVLIDDSFIMSRHFICHALVLRAVDIGEADRFCILLTREHGRIGARASGVRKPGSRMAGHLLSLSLVAAELSESSSGTRITAARPLEMHGPEHRNIRGFLHAQQGVEFLLKLLQDDEPMPDVFALAAEFLTLCNASDRSPVVPFGLRLLIILGLLPLSAQHPSFCSLGIHQRAFILRCAAREELSLLMQDPACDASVEGFLYGVLDEHLSSPLKARTVANAI